MIYLAYEFYLYLRVLSAWKEGDRFGRFDDEESPLLKVGHVGGGVFIGS